MGSRETFGMGFDLHPRAINSCVGSVYTGLCPSFKWVPLLMDGGIGPRISRPVGWMLSYQKTFKLLFDQILTKFKKN